MEQWHCFKCKEKMVESTLQLTYLKITDTIRGIKCPKCGAAYVLEQTAVVRMVKAEEMTEKK